MFIRSYAVRVMEGVLRLKYIKKQLILSNNSMFGPF